jgi:sugar-specific transcriptional regulator TrmB
MKTTISKLTQLGLTDYEAKAYTALLRDNPLTAYEISKNSGIPSSKVYEVIKRLEAKQVVQSIHGERSRMFIPIPPDEFIDSFRTAIEDSLDSVRSDLRRFRVARSSGYTWHINDYEGLILKAKRMIDTSQKTVLLSLWPPEMNALEKSLSNAETRGVRLAIVHYGTTNIKLQQLYRHPVEDTMYSVEGSRGFTIVADSKEALIGRIEEQETEAIWSMNRGFVMMAEDYIRHDIYVMKIVRRLDPILKDKFGLRYEKLRDVFSDKEEKK